jgi:hypothetical protein
VSSDCSESLKVFRRETNTTQQAAQLHHKPQPNQQSQQIPAGEQQPVVSDNRTPAISTIKEEFSFMYRALSTDARLEDTFMDLLSNQTIATRLGQCVGIVLLTTAAVNPDWLCSFGFHLFICLSRSYSYSYDGSHSPSSSSSKSDEEYAIRLGLCGYIFLLIISCVGEILARSYIDQYDGRRNGILKLSTSFSLIISFVVLGSFLLWECKVLRSVDNASDDFHYSKTIHRSSSSSQNAETFSWLFTYFLHVLIWISACSCMFILSYGLQCFQYVYALEIFPYRARAKMISLWIACMFFINAIVSQLYVSSLFELYYTMTTIEWDATQSQLVQGSVLQVEWLHAMGQYLLCIGGIVIPFVLFCSYFTIPETSGKYHHRRTLLYIYSMLYYYLYFVFSIFAFQ